MADFKLEPNEKLDVREIMKDLDKYEPRRRGWTWRKHVDNLEMGPFQYHDCSEPLNFHLQNTSVASTRSRIRLSPRKSLPEDLRMTSAE